MRGWGDPTSPRRIVEYGPCPDCTCWSCGIQANGRLTRHSVGVGYVEKVGPGTRYPFFRTTICPGSGKRVRPALPNTTHPSQHKTSPAPPHDP